MKLNEYYTPADYAPKAKVIQVIEVLYVVGDGFEEPVRECEAYYSMDGELLTVKDPYADKEDSND